MTAPAASPSPHVAFAALRHPGFRQFFAWSAMAMMADSIEHVISYWVIFQKFHSAALGGFAVISHWLPFLLFSVYSGALSDRYDPRRMIQLGMGLFAGVSLAWGALFITDSLQLWHAATLLIVHGCAGVLWGAPAQVLIYDIVGPAHLQSAVRLNATARQLGLLTGPAIGGAFLLTFGPKLGILVNAALYLPFILWLVAAPYGPKFRAAGSAVRQRAIRTLGDVWRAAQEVGRNRVIATMTALAGSASLFIGNAYQAQMPGFAQGLGHGHVDFSYSALLAADAAGALTAGILLESRSLLRPAVRSACVLAMLWCVLLAAFAFNPLYPLSLVLLFCAGFVELAFNAMSQTLVQLEAPVQMRGKAIGVYNMFAMGMRTFSGVTVGLVGQQIGIHWSLALSATLLFIVVGLLMNRVRRAA
ncbi:MULTISPECIES: MFS transporter [Hydrocarboniphaga]|uniref:Major facilitator superfamily (MFS) profile domain-containing protein n=1 Tax=Hydrocarboniphaga effusa AP103 TaxID=1172194 RepID=I8TCZ4_9GAMM|nr:MULTISPECIES: MFS transporter [Hydrocarboniphaga]EIT71855.1 hypothetical protein WQQ_19920 [Hydrocarboniphaga effusa AP103]MDZ4077444.1 MFS transporter [Hydrocarboniphaga sp.]